MQFLHQYYSTTEGICTTESCLCFSADERKIVGYDASKDKFISVDLFDGTAKEYSFSEHNRSVLRSFTWESLISVSKKGLQNHYIALLKPGRNEESLREEPLPIIILQFLLNDESASIQMNSEQIEDCNFEERLDLFDLCGVRLRRDKKTDQIYYLSWRLFEGEKATAFTIMKVSFDADGKIDLQNAVVNFLVDAWWRCPVIFDSRVVFLSASKVESVLMLSVPQLADAGGEVPVEDMQACHMTEGDDVDNLPDDCDFTFLGVLENADHLLVFEAFSNKDESSVIVSMDLKRREWQFLCKFTDNFMSDRRFALTSGGQIALNGNCSDKEKWQVCGFAKESFQLKTVKDSADFGDSPFLSLSELSFLLSLSPINVIFGRHSAAADSIDDYLLLLKIRFEIFMHAAAAVEDSAAQNITRIVAQCGETMKCKLEEMLSETETNVIFKEKNLLEKDEVGNFSLTDLNFYDGLTLSFTDRVNLIHTIKSGRRRRAVIRLCEVMPDGYDHPKNIYCRWFKVTPTSPCPLSDLTLQDNENNATKANKADDGVSADPGTSNDQKKANVDGKKTQTPSKKKNILTKNFTFEASQKLMNQHYPKWREILSSTVNCSPICIPPCADVEVGASTDKAGKRGRGSERLVTEAIRAMNNGGIVINGLKTIEFKKYARTLSAAHRIYMDKEQKRFFEILTELEIDTIFIHGRIGVFLIETKSSESVLPKAKAIDQLKGLLAALPLMFEAATATENILLKDEHITTIGAFAYGQQMKWVKFDGEDFTEEINFSRAFLEKAQKECCFIANEKKLEDFVLALATCRTLDFVTVEHNAQKINDLIEQQQCNAPTKAQARKKAKAKTKKLKEADENGKKKEVDDEEVAKIIQDESKKPVEVCPKIVYFASEQQSEPQPVYLSDEERIALECDAECQIIIGAAGTGKTLILLLKILENMAKEPQYRAVVYASNRKLLSRMAILLQKNGQMTTTANVLFTEDRYSGDVDLFYDEVAIDSSLADFLLRQKQRENAPRRRGRLVLAISGNINPANIARKLDDFLAERNCQLEIAYTPLTKVYRGTRRIVDEWRPYYDGSISTKINIGHDICGQKVYKNLSLVCCEKILQNLVEEMTPFLTVSADSESKQRKRNHIAVISEEVSLSVIKCYLADKGIPCGTCQEQVNNPYLVAVDDPLSCLSFEWPNVFFVSFDVGSLGEAQRLIACSRAMSRLFIFERDIRTIQEAIDALIMGNNKVKHENSDKNLQPNEMTLVEFTEIVKTARERIGASDFSGKSDWSAMTVDRCLAIIRHDFLPSELRDDPNCSTFSEYLLRSMNAMDSRCFLQNFCSETLAVWLPQTNFSACSEMPKLLAEFCWSNCDESERRIRWKNVKGALLRLADAHRAASDEDEAKYHERGREFFDKLYQLNLIETWQHGFQHSFEHVFNACFCETRAEQKCGD